MEESGYPNNIGIIILENCAVSGCHNNASYSAAANLNLTTWHKMFEGSSSGSIAIPYRADFSPLCYFTNTDSSLGIVIEPTMPIGQAPLSKAVYTTLRDWISAGAPSATGEIMFTGDPARTKFYITNRLCDVVTVLDASTKLQMRYVDVGNKPGSEYPYCVKVSPDKKHWYVSFFSQSDMVQKFDADNDRLIGEIKLGTGSWTSFEITGDSKHGFFVDNSSPGKIVYADLEQMTVLATYAYDGKFQYPTGIALNEQLNKLYIGCQYGNFIYSIDIQNRFNPVITELPIDGSKVVSYQSSVDPVELIADNNASLCYISCSRSHEIRVMDMNGDTLSGNLSLGTIPAYMVIASNSNQLLVSCPDDMVTFPGNRGSVAVIDAHTLTLTKRINTGYQPYGLAFNKAQNMVAVVNANISSAGPDSHHTSGCGEKNGNVTFIDMHTVELVRGTKLEVAVYPYSAAAR